ncbi:MAG: helicase [Pseudomonadota bacterium]
METKSFAELGLSPKVLAAVEAAGYPNPTPIQSQAVPVAIEGKDILGIAQTGTGKTAAFVMPMICRLETGRARARMPRSLILAPTRELAAQVAESFAKYGVNHKLDVALLIGGVSMDDQVKKLDRGVDVLIATPGRLLDHFGRGRIMLMGVEILVIDEADRMLDMGFIPDIEKICNLLPPAKQTLFFSATMPPEITRLASQFLKDPVRIEVARPATTAKTITQRFQYCPDGEDWAKREVLRDLIRSQTDIKNAIIFCNRKRDVAILHKSLTKHGFNAGALHGDMDQSARTATLEKFRANEIQILAASDVAARGLDIPDVSHVFNFDVPWHADDYVHRIGRTGRAGRSGFAATLVTPTDVKAMNEILKLTGESATWIGEAPTDEELAEGAKRKRGRGSRDARSGRGDGRGDGGRRSGGGRDERGPRRDRSRDRPAEGTTPELRAAAPMDERPALELVEHAPREARPPRSRNRNDRPARPERSDRPERAHRPERSERGDRRDRPQRDARPSARDATNGHAPAERVREDRAPDERVREERPRREFAEDRTAAQPSRARDLPRDVPRAEPARPPAKPQRRGDGSGKPVGFEDNVPAFLRRPIRAGQ